MYKKELLRLIRLIQVITEDEFNSAIASLRAFQKSFGEYEPISIQLLLKIKSGESESLKAKVSPESSENGFRMLIARTRKKVLQSLILDVNTHREGFYSSFYRNLFEVQKAPSLFRILNGRGLRKDAEKIIDDAIKSAHKYELYAPLVDMLYLKRNHVGIRKGIVAYQKINEEAQIAETQRTALEKARDYCYMLTAKNELKGHSNDSLERVKQLIEELEQNGKKIDSGLHQYYTTRVKCHLWELMGSYTLCIDACEEILISAQTYLALEDNTIIGNMHKHLAHYSILLHDFEKATYHSKAAIQRYRVNTFNYWHTHEYLFLALYHNGETVEAHQAIVEVIKATQEPINNREFADSRRSYYNACSLFLQGRHLETHLMLQETAIIEKDKEGWNVAVRILTIMNQIDWGGTNDTSDTHINNLYHFVNYTRKIQPILDRNLLILKVLKALDRNGFNFSQTYEEERETLKELAGNGVAKYQMLKPEVIRFDTWFMAKVKKEKYAFERAEEWAMEILEGV